jgi:hypothetical protein
LALLLCGVSSFAQSDPSVVGQWTPVQQWPYLAGHAHLLPNGNVMFWPTYSNGDNPQIWDPIANTTTPATKAGYDIFCTGHSFLPNGQLFVTGGDNGSGFGIPNASIYDPGSGTWTQLPTMNGGRWYPTNTVLANGDVLVVTGQNETGAYNTLPQVWQLSTNSWRNLTSAQLQQPLYARMFLAPNGKVAYVEPVAVSQYLDTSGTGTWSNFATENVGSRDYGNAVMYDAGKILLDGGGDPPTASAEVIDLNAATPSWRLVASMANPRRQSNATLLPDGTVLVTGGSSGSGFDDQTHPVYPAELWNPATEKWTTMASISVYRGYHSTALLLPDGRVVSGGGEQGGPSYEVFSPPYLFKGARPTITSAPTSVGYGQNFFIQTPDATSITQVNWIRLSSVTHAWNMEQRLLHLSFTQGTGGLNVTSPANPNLSPPGYYMLFIVNSNGVPSVASFVLNTSSGSSIPAAPANLTATAASSTQINLSWTDDSTNETGFLIERSTDGVNFTQIATAPVNATSFQDSNLTAATTYYYRVRASGTGGNSAYSNIANATTSSSQLVPAAPTNLTATAVSGSQINLAWTDNSNNETGFLIERSLDGINFTQVATAPVNATTYQDSGLTASTTYYYRVRAAGSQSCTPTWAHVQGTQSSAVGTSASITLPSVGANLVVFSIDTPAAITSVTDGTNTYTKTPSSPAPGNNSYVFHHYYPTAPGNITVTVSTGISSTITGWMHEYSASCGTPTVDIDAGGTGTGTTVNTPPVTTLHSNTLLYNQTHSSGSISAAGGGWIGNGVINGHDSEYMFGSAIAQYAPNYTNSNSAWNGVTAAFYALNTGGGNSNYSNIASATTTAATPPAAPSNLAATTVSSTQINLTWTDNSNNETGFLLEHSIDAVNFTQIGTAPVNATTYQDSGLTASTTYFHRVRASGTGVNFRVFQHSHCNHTRHVDGC